MQPPDASEFANFRLGRETARDSILSHLSRDPSGIGLVCLSTPNRLDVLGIAHDHAHRSFQLTIDRLPETTSGLHTNHLTHILSKPIPQVMQILERRAENPVLPFECPTWGGLDQTGCDVGPMDIQSTGRSRDFHSVLLAAEGLLRGGERCDPSLRATHHGRDRVWCQRRADQSANTGHSQGLVGHRGALRLQEVCANRNAM